MKETELMVGDRVLVAGRRGQSVVSGILPDGRITVKGSNESIPMRMVYPEPLGSWDLERNGWRLKSGGWWHYQAGRCRLGWNDGRLVIGYSLVPVECRNIHEMQHVLRMCGIEKWY